jgi:hypothetical protein
MKTKLIVICAVLLGAVITIQAQPRVTTIPFAYQKGVPYVQVLSTRGHFRSMRFILDTGASPTVFNHMTATGLNLVGAQSGGNCSEAPSMYVQQVHAACGGLSLKHVALSSDMVGISMGCGHWVDGLLGTDYFRDKIVTIDFKRHQLEIQEPESKGALATMFDGIPFCDRHDSVFVTIQTAAASRPLVFLLDTGSTRTFIDLKLARKLGMNLATKGQLVHTPGGNTTAYESANFAATCKGRALPSKIYANDFSRLSWVYMKRVDGILGTDFLQAYRVHIDFQTREVNFE